MNTSVIDLLIDRLSFEGPGAARVGDDLEESAACLLLTHVPARDVLHEHGEILAKPRSLQYNAMQYNTI